MRNETLRIDTRQADGTHTLKHDYFATAGIRTVRTKLYVGDYMFVGGTTSVDTKARLLELAQNVDQQHDRFRNELVKAKEAGIKLVVLVENEDGVTDFATLAKWQNPRRFVNAKKGLRPPIDGMRLAKACLTMEKKYSARFLFCSPEEAGARVIEILDGAEYATDDA